MSIAGDEYRSRVSETERAEKAEARALAAEALLYECIKCLYSASGNFNKATALKLVKYAEEKGVYL